jgi:hypothetical protein
VGKSETVSNNVGSGMRGNGRVAVFIGEYETLVSIRLIDVM